MDTRDVLIIMTTFILTQQHQTNLTGSVLFNNNGHILAECPNNTLQIEFSSACTDTCPESTPFLFGSVCLSFCPVGYAAHAGTCMYDTPQRDQDTKINLICPTDFCPPATPYCDEYQCVTTCPQGMFIEEQSCVYTCSKSKPHIYNNICVMECPPSYPYTENDICVKNCSMGYVVLENLCVKACPHGKYRTKTKCVDSCLLEGMFELVIWNTSLCLSKCPVFTNVNGNICHTYCPHGYDLLWNMSCVAKCPDYMPFVYVLSKRLPLYKTPVCLPFCPNQTYVDGRTCVAKCSQGMKIDDRNCVRECPPIRKFIHQEHCVSKCPFVTHGTYCVRQCPTNALYTFNSTCMDKCPTGYAVLGDECVTSCPRTLILFQGKCSLTCPNDLFVFNDSCVDRCPLTHQYKDISYVRIRYELVPLIVCRQSCTRPYLYNMTCSDTCPSHTYRYNHTCVANCSEIGMFRLYSSCVSKCPFGAVINDGSCSESCTNKTPFVFNGSCRSECPSTHSIHLPDRYQNMIRCVNNCSPDRVEFQGKCVDRCPDVTAYFNGSCLEKCPLSHKFNFTRGKDQYQCVSNCKDYGSFSLNDKCVNICPHFVINSSCVTLCPESHRFVYHERTGRDMLSRCVKECPGNTYSIENECYKQCPEPFVSFLKNLSCLQQCPMTHKFRYMYSNNEKLFRCKKTCLKPLFIFGDICLHNCPISKPYSKGQTCVYTCGSSYPFFHPETKQCLKDCPQPYVLSNNTCIQKCPQDSRFLVNNMCTKSCPPAMMLWSPLQKGKICGSTCTNGFVEQNKTCVASCSGGQVIINNKCTGSEYCPREYKYTESSSLGNICRKTCLKGQYIQSLNCVRQCSSKYYVENECVDRCPITHPYTDVKIFPLQSFPKECHKNCKPSQYVDGFHCTSSCKSDLYIATDKICVNKCPPSHPFRRDNLLGAVCDKKCGDSYLIDQNNTCMKEQKCKDQKDRFIYNDRCVQECPPYSFLDMTKTRCLSLTDETLITGFILITISLGLVVCTCCLLKCRHPSFQRNISKDLEDSDEESHLLLDVNGDGGAEISQEVYNLSPSEHCVPARDYHNESEQVSTDNTSVPMVQVHAPMVPVSSSDELRGVYVGEKNIDENTQLKTTKDEEIDESGERLTPQTINEMYQ